MTPADSGTRIHQSDAPETVSTDSNTPHDTQPELEQTRTPPPQAQMPAYLVSTRSYCGDTSPSSPTSAVGRYEIQQLVGTGNYGTVFKARDPKLDRIVAVKVSKSRPSNSAEEIQRYHAEARKMAALKHPNVVPVFDVGETDDGHAYVVSEFVDGGDLEHAIAKRTCFPPLEAAAIGQQVAEALHVAHRARLFHRDVKPANILLDSQGKPLVADFGLAIHEDEQSALPRNVSGSPAYMSPEQIRGESHLLDGRTDIWALGVVLYELLTGRRPFDGRSPRELFERILAGNATPPRQRDETIPRELEAIVLKCLRREPGDRYATAKDLADDLGEWIAAQTDAPRMATLVPIEPRSRLLLPGIVVAALLVLLPVAWMLRNHFIGDTPPSPHSITNKGNATPADGTTGTLPAKAQEVNVDLRIWSEKNEARRGVSLLDKAALPLHTDDLVQIAIEADRPAYAYVVWIGADGTAQPVYPWAMGRWGSRPAREDRVTKRILPNAAEGWPVAGPAGIEMLAVFMRSKPLSIDDENTLRRSLSNFPAIASKSPRAVVHMQNDRLLGYSGLDLQAFRGVDLTKPQQVPIDPVLRRHLALRKRIGKLFPTVHTVSFANRGVTEAD